MEFYVYILECSDSSFYIGKTTNLVKRLKAHNGLIGNGAKYTRSKRPVFLVYYETAKSGSDALKREHKLKKLTHQEKKELITKVL